MNRRHEKAFDIFGKNFDKILSELTVSFRKLTVDNYVPKIFFVFHDYIYIKFTISRMTHFQQPYLSVT